MKRVIKYNYPKISQFVERAFDIKNNQFANWRSLADIKDDENIQNLGEVMFGESYENDISYQEAVRRVYEELK